MNYPPFFGRSQHGFTLVELAIVLVIIGLVIGGILVGRDMVASATIKAQINQIEKYKTAVMVFKDKYRAIPGDMSNATQFGLGSNGNGDGRMLNGNSAESQFANAHNESVGFWYHLNSAGLTEFRGIQTLPGGVYTQALFQQGNPPGKIDNTYITATSFSSNGNAGWGNALNGYVLSSASTYIGQQNWTDGLTPSQARVIDTVLDDGKPLSGKLLRSIGILRVGYCFQLPCNYAIASCINSSRDYNEAINTVACNLAFINQY